MEIKRDKERGREREKTRIERNIIPVQVKEPIVQLAHAV